jgi:hypothetical protein
MELLLVLRPPSRVLLFLTVLVALLLALALLPGLVAKAQAADRGTIFKVGGNVDVPQGDTANAVIAIGGDVTVAGTVKNTIVAVGGDVHLQSGASVGSDAKSGDSSIVLVGGDLTKAAGATQQGKTSTVSGSWAGTAWDRGIVNQFRSPLSGFAGFSWLGGTILALLGAILIAALLPRQVTAIGEGVRRRFWPSLGWGALGLIVIVPVVTVLLIITIIGLIAILPWLFVVVATAVLGAIGVSVLLGELILPRLSYRGTSLILAAVVGVVVLRLVALIPIAGGIVVAIAWVVGFGAAIMALWAWQRRRRERGRDLGEVPEERAA